MKTLSLLFAAALFASSACRRDPTATAPTAILTTDQVSYVATTGGTASGAAHFTVITTYRNVSDLPIMLERAGNNPRPAIWFQQIDNDGSPIGDENGPPCACGEGAGLLLQPGAIRTDTLTFSPSPLPATYRVYIQAELCINTPTPTACGPSVPLSDRTSAPFLVSAPPQ